MIDTVRNWYAALSLRERIMVGVAAGLTAVLVAIYGLYLPLTQAITDQRVAYREALERRVAVEAMVADLRSKSATGASARASVALDKSVQASAADAGFSLDQVAAEGDARVSFVIAQARPAALMKWLAENETAGIAVERIDVKPAGADTVSAQVQLARGEQ